MTAPSLFGAAVSQTVAQRHLLGLLILWMDFLRKILLEQLVLESIGVENDKSYVMQSQPVCEMRVVRDVGMEILFSRVTYNSGSFLYNSPRFCLWARRWKFA